MTNIYIHIDADAFFASVEQCLHRELRGKPIVTGRDGSVAVAMSYEAKALGVERAMPIHLIREEFPMVQMVASDYFMYRIFSARMQRIIKQYIPEITQSSIDECHGDISDDVQDFQEAKELALNIKQELELKLGCTFSIGISSSPLLAKMASGIHKPSGLTIIDTQNNRDYVGYPIKKVNGLGTQLCKRLSGFGIVYIRDFIREYPRIRKNFSVVTDDIFYQLQGYPPLRNSKKEDQKSMNRARSFKVSFSRDEVYGQLVLNLESLLKKMRRQNMLAKTVHVSLGDIERKRVSSKIRLDTASRDPDNIGFIAQTLFNKIYINNKGYRYVSVTLSGLIKKDYLQIDLFGESINSEKREGMYSAIDILDAKFGKPVIRLASTLTTPQSLSSHINKEENIITYQNPLLKGETFYRRVRYPYLGMI
ncbi:MAG: hypothetical protein MRY57_03530 [Candidatus Pacebacteria bacterium]|nr:hypothetical protein [Candidatus Paceibacterota bacterium]